MIIKRKPKAEAFFQIILLIVGIVAISYAIGSSVGVVSAVGDLTPACPTTSNPKSCVDNSDCGQCCDGTFLEYVGRCETIPSLNGKYCDYSMFTSRQIEGRCEYSIPDTQTDSTQAFQNRLTDTNIPLNPNLLPPIDDKSNFGLDELLSLGSYGINAYSLAKNIIPPKPPAVTPPIPGTPPPITILTETEVAKAVAKLNPWGGFILKTAAWASVLYFGIRFIGSKITDDVNIQRGFNTAAAGSSIGFTAGRIATQIVMKQVAKKVIAQYGTQIAAGTITAAAAQGAVVGELTGLVDLMALPGFGWMMAGAGIIISLLFFKNERYQQITFQCNAWQPQTGGDDCELCNNQGLFPCTDYQCRSLGQGCELINLGTGNEKCVWVNPNDIKYPIIGTWTKALLNEKYKYSPADAIAPPDRGAFIKYQSSDGCVPAFTPLSFGVSLDEPARCKISPIRTSSFETMGNLFLSGGIADYNHSFSLSMPGLNSLTSENITIENDGNYELYVRCEDKNGNSNPANFVFKYCVDPEPDYTNPLIVFADPVNGKPVSHNTESLTAMFYINEPAECRWSHLDQDYENMENTMSCATNIMEMNAYMLYPCETTLTGLQNNIENKFYVRCKDQPSSTELRNTNTESYEYILIGTEPLILSEVTPNNTIIKGPTSSVKVTIEAETSAGYDDGISLCYYSETGEEGSYVQFYDTNSFKHSQDLWVSQGSYNFHIKCIDLGGNPDTATINFEVETDTAAPIIVRVYHEGDYLKLITDEEAVCRYGTSSNIGCDYNFEEGTLMISMDNDFEHYVDWESNTNFYIKCGEIREGGIYPPQNECSLIARPFDIYS